MAIGAYSPERPIPPSGGENGMTQELGKTTPASLATIGRRSIDVILRLAILFLFILLFIPDLNPARITEKINRNLSLFTCGFFYPNLIADMGRLLDKGWILNGTMQLLFISAMAACLGIIGCGAGACMSAGNDKLKRIGSLVSLGGSAVIGLGLLGIQNARGQLMASTAIDKALPIQPPGFAILMVATIAVFAFSALRFLAAPVPKKGEKCGIDAPMELFLWLLPFLLLIFVFSYLPLWGWRYAFFNFHAGERLTPDKFVGFFWFTYLFKNSATCADIIRVLTNTLAMSGLGILTSWCPIAFAVFMAEIGNTGVRRAIQTLTTIPNFISWVLVYAIAFCIFSTDGFVSSVFVNAKLWDSGKNLLMGGEHMWLKMLAWGMWKGLGWSAIMYIAAITSIDQQLYEAATVDGAGRFQKMWHITVPELIPTYLVLLLLQIAGILNNGMEQYLVFENPTNTGPIMVLDLYIYKLGIDKGVIPLSTVIGMAKSAISVALLFGANAISKAVRGKSIV
jgi:putative aldouronate transport system permease protein